jgi:hypothetical protein
MFVVLILGLIAVALGTLQRAVRTRQAYPLAVGGACILLDAVVITLLSL